MFSVVITLQGIGCSQVVMGSLHMVVWNLSNLGQGFVATT